MIHNFSPFVCTLVVFPWRQKKKKKKKEKRKKTIEHFNKHREMNVDTICPKRKKTKVKERKRYEREFTSKKKEER